MKDAFAKILALAFGAVVGWLILNPPDWPAPTGLPGVLIVIAILTGILIVSIIFSIGLSFPKNITLNPYGGPVDASVDELAREIKALGFIEIGEPMIVGIRPPAVMRAFVHNNEPVYATVFRTGTVPGVTSYDFVSIFERTPGGLTTNTTWRGGTLPSTPGSFRQILQGANPRQAFEAHLAGARWLSDRGLWMKSLSAEGFPADFIGALGRQREAFRASPVGFAATGLWRTIARRVPDRGLLSAQRGAEARVRKCLSSIRP